MDRTAFLRLLAREFYPALRQEGFKGSGTTLRRIDGPLLHVFNVQGSSGGAGFYINLGAHLEFIDGRDLGKARESNCAFRTRLDPATDYFVNRWPYGNSETEALAIIEELSDVWASQGQEFFATYADYPDAIERLVQTTDASQIHPHHAFTLAKIAKHMGHRGRAEEIAGQALAEVPKAATSLLGNIKAFLRDMES